MASRRGQSQAYGVMPIRFSIGHHQVNGETYVVEVVGELDVYTAPLLRTTLSDVIDEGGLRLILDFTAVSFICSVTLGVIIAAIRRLRDRGGSLRVAADPSGAIRKIIDIVGWEDILPLYESVASAIESDRPGKDSA